MPCKPLNYTPIFTNDSSTLASQHDDCDCSCKPGNRHPKCDHYGKLGHKIDKCYALHGHPPRSDVIVQRSSLTIM